MIIVRQLHHNTAARLEQSCFFRVMICKEYGEINCLRTNRRASGNLVNQVYGKWVATNMDPIGMAAVNMLSVGVVVMLLWLDCWCCTIDI